MREEMNLSADIEAGLASFGFRPMQYDHSRRDDCKLILKRQTWNTNRAVCVLEKESPPHDYEAYIKEVRKMVAYKAKFFPFLYGIGIQIVFVCPGILKLITEPKDYVSKIDNQWAIVQSLFLIDPETKTFKEGRTWGQVVTGKFQDAISEIIAAKYERSDS